MILSRLDDFLIPAVIAFVISGVLTPITGWLAKRANIVAIPKADRWHDRRVPLLGGVAVVLAAVAAVLLHVIPRPGPVLWSIVAGGLMFLVGLVDDLLRIKPNTKLTAQIAIACLVVLVVPAPHWVGVVPVDTVITILWIVGITNALNLLDNMDGLCAGIAAIAAVAYCGGVQGADPAAVSFAAAIAGACAGFLLYNFQPASIFMGDSGSLFLGGSLATLVLGVTPSDGKPGFISAMAVPVILMLIPIFDTTFVTISRKLSFRAASTGGRDHTSHRLVALGFSEREAVLLCYVLAAAAGASAILVGRTSLPEAKIVVTLLVILLVLLSVHLGKVKVYDGRDYAVLHSTRITPLIVNMMYKRRIFEVLLDLCLVTVAYYAAYVIRFDQDFPIYYDLFERSLPIVIAAELLVFFAVGLYRGVWRYLSVADLTTYAKCVSGGTLVSVMAIVYVYRFEGFSRGVFVINAMALGLLLVGSRVSFRVFGELAARHKVGGRAAVVYGAGDGGVLLIRELRSNPTHGYRPVVLIDDDVTRQRKRILGVPVVGTLDALPDVIGRFRPDAVIVSTPKIADERLARVHALCYQSGTELMQLDVRLLKLQPSAGSLQTRVME